MAESAELLAELLGRGMTKRAIGRAIGRDSSLLSQVESGRKPGTKLAPALRDVLGRLDAGAPPAVVAPVGAPPVVAVAPRLNRAGQAVKVRRAATFRGGSGRWSVTKLGRQAAHGQGGHRLYPVLADHSEAGRSVAVDLSFGKGAHVHGTSGGRRKGAGTVTMKVDPDELLAAADANGGDVAAALVAMAEAAGHVTAPGGTGDLTGVQLRSFTE